MSVAGTAEKAEESAKHVEELRQEKADYEERPAVATSPGSGVWMILDDFGCMNSRHVVCFVKKSAVGSVDVLQRAFWLMLFHVVLSKDW